MQNLIALSLAFASVTTAADLAGVVVKFEKPLGSATLAAELIEKFKLRIDVAGTTEPIMLRVELPGSGSNTWPMNDVEVRDAAGHALLVQRSGIEWEKLLIPLPSSVTSCTVQAVEPLIAQVKTTAPKEREIKDTTSGLHVRLANWPEGRTAALSLRFDDSHPTHLSKAIPILREFGFKGTFMVNPGPKEPGMRQSYSFETQHAEWAAVMKQGDMELANHSAHHRGAEGDEDMEREIGGAAEAIWKLRPGKSKLMALNLGGGTRWATTRTLRYYLDKYHQFDAASGSLGMDDSYGGRVEAFRKALATHLDRGLWCRIHFHYIGDGLSSSEANFRAALDIAKQNQDKLWIASMADIHKYQAERNSARITLLRSDAKSLTFELECATNETLFDQPLTLEIIPPEGAKAASIVIRDESAQPISTTTSASGLRCSVPPRKCIYSLSVAP